MIPATPPRAPLRLAILFVAAFAAAAATAAPDPAKCAVTNGKLIPYREQERTLLAKIKAVEERHGVAAIKRERDDAKLALLRQNSASMGAQRTQFDRDAGKARADTESLTALTQQLQELQMKLLAGEITPEQFKARSGPLREKMKSAASQTQQSQAVVAKTATSPAGAAAQQAAQEQELQANYQPRIDAAQKAADAENKPTREALDKLRARYEMELKEEHLNCSHDQG